MTDSVTRQLADWYATLAYEDLPEDVIASTRLRVLDVLGLSLAPVGATFGNTVRAAVLEMGTGHGSRMLGYGDETSPMLAAIVNGSMAHALEFCDTQNETMTHVSSPTVTTALTLGESLHLGGREFLTVCAGASEITARIAAGAPGQFHKNGFHSTGVVGTFGAAYIASRLHGLDAQRMTHCAGIVGSQASGLMECWSDGTWSKFIHPGWAAHCGISSALLAKHGYTGPATILEGRFGLFRSHVQDPGYRHDFERIVNALGSHWENRRISFKPYPTAHVIHPFIDAILALHRAGLRAEDVERIICPVADYMVPIVCEPRAEKIAPASDWHGRVSLAYTLAEALHHGRLGARGYAEESIRNPDILALARKVGYEIDATAPGRERFKGWVIVHTTDGRRWEHVEPANRGSFDNPMGAEDIRAKFRENASPALSGERIERVIEAVDRLETLPDVKDLVTLCVR
jgi:2-methylcitrate dehydratase PrpD